MGLSTQTVTYAFVCTHSHNYIIIASLFLCNKIHIGTWYPLHKIKVSCFSELIVVSLLASLLCLLVDCCITSCPSLSYFWHSFHNWHYYRQEVSVTLGLMLMTVWPLAASVWKPCHRFPLKKHRIINQMFKLNRKKLHINMLKKY